jgi:hypothetical protein
MSVAYSGRPDMVTMMLQLGANPDLQDNVCIFSLLTAVLSVCVTSLVTQCILYIHCLWLFIPARSSFVVPPAVERYDTLLILQRVPLTCAYCTVVCLPVQNGYTALMRAAEAGHIECCKQLANASQNSINMQDKDGNSAMMVAAGNGHNAVVHLLIEHRGGKLCNLHFCICTYLNGTLLFTDVLLKNKDDHTALTKAMAGYGDAATVLLLCSRNVMVNASVRVSLVKLLLACVYLQQNIGSSALERDTLLWLLTELRMLA